VTADPASQEILMSRIPKTFLVCHGAWGGGWAWRKMHPLMQTARHRLLTPTYTGLGERAHLAVPSIDLDAHIQDILNVIFYEDLRDIVLVGHSYGGMVATGVADRARDRIAQLIYLDAFVPDDGQRLLDFLPAHARCRGIRRRLARASQSDTCRYIAGGRGVADPASGRHAAQVLEQKLRLQEPLTLPRSYIYCTRIPPADLFGPFARRARTEPGWRCVDIDASHAAMLAAPDALMALLLQLSG
jgi:pimeloyl-ACP methyl ester carboxylesterase